MCWPLSRAGVSYGQAYPFDHNKVMIWRGIFFKEHRPVHGQTRVYFLRGAGPRLYEAVYKLPSSIDHRIVRHIVKCCILIHVWLNFLSSTGEYMRCYSLMRVFELLKLLTENSSISKKKC